MITHEQVKLSLIESKIASGLEAMEEQNLEVRKLVSELREEMQQFFTSKESRTRKRGILMN